MVADCPWQQPPGFTPESRLLHALPGFAQRLFLRLERVRVSEQFLEDLLALLRIAIETGRLKGSRHLALRAEFLAQALRPPALALGANLGAPFNSSINSVARPASGGWQLGAYQGSSTNSSGMLPWTSNLRGTNVP